MFRLADFQEGTPLYKYLSTISSASILDALDDVYWNMPMIEELYTTFLRMYEGSIFSKASVPISVKGRM